MSEEDKICFVIAPIGQEGSKTRKRSDQILAHIIRPAAEHCGYRAMRADEISEPGQITHQVITHVMEDSMVVADLTGWNPNVFYELALRHVARLPFVQLFQPTPGRERIPFDVAGLRAVHLNYPDWDSIPESRDKLIEAVEAAEQMDSDKLVTPVSYAVDLKALRESEDPEQRALARIEDLEARMRAVESKPRVATGTIRTIPVGQPMMADEYVNAEVFKVTIPSGTTLWSSGSIEPVKPTLVQPPQPVRVKSVEPEEESQ